MIISLIPFIGPQAQAFFHWEAGIGYNRGHFHTNKSQGLGLSTKLGVEFGSAFTLLDIGFHNLQLGSTPTSTLTDLGLAFGGEVGDWRAWYTHLFSANLEIPGSNPTTYTGDGFELGLGGRLSSNIWLNLETRFVDLKERTNNSGSSTVTRFIDGGYLSISWELF